MKRLWPTEKNGSGCHVRSVSHKPSDIPVSPAMFHMEAKLKRTKHHYPLVFTWTVPGIKTFPAYALASKA